MILKAASGRSELERLIIQHIPRDAIMAFEDAYHNGDVKGRTHASAFAKATGLLRPEALSTSILMKRFTRHCRFTVLNLALFAVLTWSWGG